MSLEKKIEDDCKILAYGAEQASWQSPIEFYRKYSKNFELSWPPPKNDRDCTFERGVRLPNSRSAYRTPENVSYEYSKNDLAHSILLAGVVCFGSSTRVWPNHHPCTALHLRS